MNFSSRCYAFLESKIGRGLLFLGLILLWIFRAPEFLFDPTLFAEDASHHFTYAYYNEWYNGLIFTPSGKGYFHFLANFGVVLALALVDITQIARVTSLVALSYQAIPLIIIFFGQSRIWKKWPQRLFAACILIFGQSIYNHVVASGFQFTLLRLLEFSGVVSIILLTEDHAKASKPWLAFLTLTTLIAGLTGTHLTFMIPALALYWFWYPNRKSFVILSAATLAGLFQIFIFVLTKLSSGLASNRSGPYQLLTLLKEIAHWIVINPIFGTDLGSFFFANFNSVFLCLLAYLFLAYLFKESSHFAKRVLFPALALDLLLSSYGSLNHSVGGRYAVVPGTAFLILLYDFYLNNKNKIGQRPSKFGLGCLGLLIFSVSWGLFHYHDNYDVSKRVGNYHSWQEDAAEWLKDDSKPFIVIPRWPLYLSEKNRTIDMAYQMGTLKQHSDNQQDKSSLVFENGMPNYFRYVIWPVCPRKTASLTQLELRLTGQESKDSKSQHLVIKADPSKRFVLDASNFLSHQPPIIPRKIQFLKFHLDQDQFKNCRWQVSEKTFNIKRRKTWSLLRL